MKSFKYNLYALLLSTCANCTYAVDADFSISTLNTSPTYPNYIKLSNVNVSGNIYSGIFKWNRLTNSFDFVSAQTNPCFQKAPTGTPENPEQQLENSYGNAKTVSPPLGYKGISGWIAAVNSGSQFGQVSVRSLKVYAIDPQTNNRELVDSRWACWDNNDTGMCWRAIGGAGYILDRTDWQCDNGKCWDLRQQYFNLYGYGSADGKADPIDYANSNDTDATHKIVTISNYGTLASPTSDATVVFPTSRYHKKVFHAWNTRWPTAKAFSDKQYQVEAEVLIEGAGMVQIGYDFLPETDSGGNTHKQGAISFWECSSTAGNWVKIRAGIPSSIDYSDP